MPLPSDAQEEGEDPPVHDRPAQDDAADALDEPVSTSSRVNVVVESWANASELYIVNRAYALVAKGVGTLDLMLEPGQYKVRQRIGYSEHVQDLDVPSGQLFFNAELPALDFPSPIPLPGTSLASNMETRPFSMGAGNFRFILRTPVEPGSSVSAAQVEHMRAELGRLRLESFDGQISMLFGEASAEDAALDALVFGATLKPGAYVLVQQLNDQRQICMPVGVYDGRITAVFSLALSDEGEPVSVQLGHSAVAMLRRQDLTVEYERSLLCLEAARKAIGAGRHVYGWSKPPRGHSLTPEVENALLLLMDAQLGWRCLNPRITDQGEPLPDGERPTLEMDAGGVSRIVHDARSILGAENADVAALIEALDIDRDEKKVSWLRGPPLLKRSWDQLLSTSAGNALASKLMMFAFQVEPSPTWFLWSEAPGARAAAVAAAKAGVTRGGGVRSGGARGGEAAAGGLVLNLPRIGGTGGLSEVTKTSPSLSAAIALGLNAMRQLIRWLPILKKTPSAEVQDRVTIEDVEAMLAALLSSKSFQEWLSKAQQVFDAEGKTIKDESMRQLLASLRAFSDETLISALGAEAVAKEVLAMLRLPQGQVMQLVKDLLKGVVTRLAGPDRTEILAVLHGVVDVGEAWLLAPPEPPDGAVTKP